MKWLKCKTFCKINYPKVWTKKFTYLWSIASWYFAFLHFFYAIVRNWWLDMWLVDEFSSVYHIFNRWKIRLLTFKSFVLRRKFALPSFNDVSCAGKRFTLVRIRAIVHFNGWGPASSMLLHYYSFFCLYLLEGNILWMIFFLITMITILLFFFLLFDVFVIWDGIFLENVHMYFSDAETRISLCLKIVLI